METIKPLEYPEIKELFGELFEALIGESDRSAFVIGQVYLENHLQKLFEVVFPIDMGKKSRKELFEGINPLSSFSARIKVAYAMRLIPKWMSESLHAYRNQRNDLAHFKTKATFNLKERQEIFSKIFSFDSNSHLVIRKLSIELSFEIGVDRMLNIVVPKLEKEYPDIKDKIKNRKDVITYFRDNPELIAILEEELPQWMLLIGILTLCGFIVYYREQIKFIQNEKGTLDAILKKKMTDYEA